MKKLVISASVSLQDRILHWKTYFEDQGYEVIDYPQPIDSGRFEEEYPAVHKRFYENLNKADVLFVMNEDKERISGYIGPSVFAEISCVVVQGVIENKNTEVKLLKMPSKEVGCYDEINLWLKLGWVEILGK